MVLPVCQPACGHRDERPSFHRRVARRRSTFWAATLQGFSPMPEFPQITEAIDFLAAIKATGA
jgi:hypothetical protein